jgi:hypothetical protein
MNRIRVGGLVIVVLVLLVLCVGYYVLHTRSNNGRRMRSMLNLHGLDGELSVSVYDPGTMCISIEGGNDDFSNCARRVVYGDGAEGSDGTEQAVRILRQCLQANHGKGVLIGHGYMGSIRTGGGDMVPTPDQIITNDRPEDWEASFEELRTEAKDLTLFGCWTGADSDGRDLVDGIRKATGAQVVRAQNSVVFCDAKKGHFYQDAHATWVESATTGLKQANASRRVPDLSDYKCLRLVKTKHGQLERQILKLEYEDTSLIRLDTTRVKVTLPNIGPNLLGSPEFVRTQTRLLLDEIDFCNPIMFLVADLRATGTFDLSMDGETRHFAILGDTMVQDRDYPEVLYWMKPDGFEQFQKQLQIQLELLYQTR